MDLKKLEGIFEGMLFASGDKVSIEKLSSITGIDKKTVKLVINNMIVKYNNDPSRGITNKGNKQWLSALFKAGIL